MMITNTTRPDISSWRRNLNSAPLAHQDSFKAYLPDAAVPDCPCDRASCLSADRSAAGSRPARPLPDHGSRSAGTPTAATAWPGPTRDPHLRTAAAWRYEQITSVSLWKSPVECSPTRS